MRVYVHTRNVPVALLQWNGHYIETREPVKVQWTTIGNGRFDMRLRSGGAGGGRLCDE